MVASTVAGLFRSVQLNSKKSCSVSHILPHSRSNFSEQYAHTHFPYFYSYSTPYALIYPPDDQGILVPFPADASVFSSLKRADCFLGPSKLLFSAH